MEKRGKEKIELAGPPEGINDEISSALDSNKQTVAHTRAPRSLGYRSLS